VVLKFCFDSFRSLLLSYILIWQTNDQQTYTSLDQVVGTGADPKPGVFPSYASMNSSTAPSLPLATLLPPQVSTPALLGKG